MLRCCDEIMLRDEITGLDGIYLIRIRIQNFRLNTDPDPGLDDQKLKKIYS